MEINIPEPREPIRRRSVRESEGILSRGDSGRVEICLAVSLSLHHVAFSNNYSVHCCAHIMLGRGPHIRTHTHTSTGSTHARRHRRDNATTFVANLRRVFVAYIPPPIREQIACCLWQLPDNGGGGGPPPPPRS